MKLLTAFYDLAYGPVSFDFVTWLVRAMLEQQRAGCDRLHVVIVPKDGGLGGFARHWGKHDDEATRWRLQHIVIPAASLAAATVTMAPSALWAKRLQVDSERVQAGPCWWPEGKAHFMGPLVEAGRRGEQIPMLRATDAARRYVAAFRAGRYGPLATLTLRNQETDPDRNTDPEEWTKLGAWLVSRGFDVVTLDEANEALAGGRACFEADVDLRLALYEAAAMNFIGNNGPQELLKFSATPYLAFGQALGAGWREHFRKYFSMEVGDQLPWAQPNQRLVYQPATFAVMGRAFEALAP